MFANSYRSFQHLIFSPYPWVQRATLALLIAGGALVIALFIGVTDPVIALAVAVALIGGALILADTHWGFVALAGVAFVLPFASLPFSIGFKPTFLDAALGALFFVWLFKLVIGQQRDFIVSPIGLLVALFMLMAIFSFANGLTHSPATSFLLRRFAEIILGIMLLVPRFQTAARSAARGVRERPVRRSPWSSMLFLRQPPSGCSIGWRASITRLATMPCAGSKTTPPAQCAPSARQLTPTCWGA